MKINAEITYENLAGAMCVLIGDGMDEDQAQVVLQAIGYTLLNAELFPDDDDEFDYDTLMEVVEDMKPQKLVELYEEEIDKLKRGDIVHDKLGNEVIIDDVYWDGDLDCLMAQDTNENHYFVGDLYWLI